MLYLNYTFPKSNYSVIYVTNLCVAKEITCHFRFNVEI
jgi:hypothetical protein